MIDIGTALAPAAISVGADCAPYLSVVPYWKYTTVAELFGLTVAETTAEL